MNFFNTITKSTRLTPKRIQPEVTAPANIGWLVLQEARNREPKTERMPKSEDFFMLFALFLEWHKSKELKLILKGLR